MYKRSVVCILFFIAFANNNYSQSLNKINKINKTNEVWAKFYQAFETLDHTLMAEIHSKDLVRISGGKQIRNYDTCINRYKSNFEYAKRTDMTNNISLRFFERINNDSVASERGIYRLIRNKNKTDEQTYYGQFHVIFRKEQNAWKILMDYDSTEGNTIDEDDFKKAYAIDNFKPFVKE